jgi:hypothetical protein
MSITKEDHDRLVELEGVITEALTEAEHIIKCADHNLYEQWKAYGKQVTDEFITMGPSLSKVVSDLKDEIEED